MSKRPRLRRAWEAAKRPRLLVASEAAKHPRLLVASEAAKLTASGRTAPGRVSVWAASPCLQGRVRDDSLAVGGGLIGTAAASRASCIRAAAVGFVFFLPCQAGIMFSANGSSYDNYRCLALD
jgi:hypothetical protein